MRPVQSMFHHRQCHPFRPSSRNLIAIGYARLCGIFPRLIKMTQYVSLSRIEAAEDALSNTFWVRSESTHNELENALFWTIKNVLKEMANIMSQAGSFEQNIESWSQPLTYMNAFATPALTFFWLFFIRAAFIRINVEKQTNNINWEIRPIGPRSLSQILHLWHSDHQMIPDTTNKQTSSVLEQ